MRWPRADRHVLAHCGLWLVGAVIAILLPALLVPPSEAAQYAGGEVLLAFSCTVVGAGIMALAGGLMYRRTGLPLAWVFAAIPPVAVIVSGAIIVAAATFE